LHVVAWSPAACSDHFQLRPRPCTTTHLLSRSMWPPQPPLSPPPAPEHAAVSRDSIHIPTSFYSPQPAAHPFSITYPPHMNTAPHHSRLPPSSNTFISSFTTAFTNHARPSASATCARTQQSFIPFCTRTHPQLSLRPSRPPSPPRSHIHTDTLFSFSFFTQPRPPLSPTPSLFRSLGAFECPTH
jgi:hypothetical protein